MRRELSGVFLALALLCAQGPWSTGLGIAPGVAALASQTATQRPNIVLILVDDLDARSLEANFALFPNLDTLRRQGASLEQFFATTPLCCPSRASILRGQYAHNHGVLQNGGETGGFGTFFRLGREESTLATWLQSAGYRTGLFGKYLNGYPAGASPTHVPDGWDEWHSFDYGSPSQNDSGFFSDYTLVENGRIVHYGGEPDDYSTDMLTAKSDTFIREAAADGEPFFAFLNPYAPHQPAQPAVRHADLLSDVALQPNPSLNEADVADKPAFVREAPELTREALDQLTALHQNRLRTLLAVDEMVGAVVQTLREAGAFENTYIVFTSDNGFLLGEHRLPHGKQAPYEEAIRVPTFIQGPGIDAGVSVREIGLNIDVAPSIADWAGIEPPDFVDGRSLAPLLADEMEGTWRQTVLIENFRVPRERRRDDAAVVRGSPPVPPYLALRTDALLYVEYEGGDRELYDLANDPYQLENLASRLTSMDVEPLSARLALLQNCAADQCRAAEDAPLADVEVLTAAFT